MQNTVEAQFLKLEEAIGDGTVTRVSTMKAGQKYCKPLGEVASKNMLQKLAGTDGEWYGGRWAAGRDALKRLGYQAIFVHVEE